MDVEIVKSLPILDFFRLFEIFVEMKKRPRVVFPDRHLGQWRRRFDHEVPDGFITDDGADDGHRRQEHPAFLVLGFRQFAETSDDRQLENAFGRKTDDYGLRDESAGSANVGNDVDRGGSQVVRSAGLKDGVGLGREWREWGGSARMLVGFRQLMRGLGLVPPKLASEIRGHSSPLCDAS